jgi:hypothetical protein
VRVLFNAFIAAIVIFTGCTAKESDERTWRVVMMGSSKSIKPDVAHYSLVSYILKQTHEPLFRYDSDHRIISRILHSWERSPDYKTFNLCLNPAAKFEHDLPFQIDDLIAALNKSTSLKIAKFQAYKKESAMDCLRITLSLSQPKFFDSLTGLETAPSRATKNPAYEIGLGPYRVDQLSENEIILVRKTSDPKIKFNRIEIRNIEGMTAEELNDRRIDDFNLITMDRIPDWVKKEFTVYPVAPLEVYVMLINVADKNVRKVLYNCLSVLELRDAFFKVEKTALHEVGSFVPVGVRGAKLGPVKQECSDLKASTKRPLKLLNWKPKQHQPLSEVFTKLEKATGLKVEVEDGTLADIAHKVVDLHSGYDLVIISLANDRAVQSDYLEMFLDPSKRAVMGGPKEIERAYLRLKTLSDERQVDQESDRLNRWVLAEYLGLPLFQPIHQTYYPSHLKSVQFGNSFSEYPEIDGVQ